MPATHPHPAADQPTLLIIDDDTTRGDSIARAMQQAGWQVDLAATGAEGLTLWEQVHPDIVLADVVLPDISGLEVSRLIKQQADQHHSLVILLSGKRITSEEQALALEQGSDGYIAYPVSMREMKARLSAGLRLLQSEQERRTSDLRFRSLFEHMLEGMALHRLIYDDQGEAIDYQIIEANPAYEELTGIPHARALSQTARQLYGTGEAPYVERYAQVARTGVPAMFDTYVEPIDRHFVVSAFSWGEDMFATTFSDITEQVRAEAEREALIARLRKALNEVQELHGLLPICAQCKKIRDDQGYWSSVEDYISEHSRAVFSHGLCPDCLRALYPDLADEVLGSPEDEG